MRHFTVRVTPNFRPRGANVRERIVGVAELIEYLAFALGLHGECQITRVFHAVAFGGFGEDELSAIHRHRYASLDREIVGHD